MPMWDYLCRNKTCRYHTTPFEEIVKGKPATHPCTCGDIGDLVKGIRKTNFQLKGTGWYVTDYKDHNSSSSGKD